MKNLKDYVDEQLKNPEFKAEYDLLFSKKREIKFRGKRIDNGEWVYGFYWFVEEHYNEKFSEKHFVKSVNNGIDYEVILETVGQYTGLKDDDEKEIYEGDICKCLNSYGEDYYESRITHNFGSFCVDVWGCDYDFTTLGWALENNDINEIEVIGTIYG